MAVTVKEDIEQMKKEVEEASDILLSSETWIGLGMVALKIIFIILLAVIVVRIGKSVISRAFQSETERRLATLRATRKDVDKITSKTRCHMSSISRRY